MTPPTKAEVASIERELEAHLRIQVVDEIQRRGLGPRQLAESLGMLVPSAELLLDRKEWPLEVSLRVATGLGMKVEVVAKPSAD